MASEEITGMSTNPYRQPPQTGEHMTVEEYLSLDGLEDKYEFEDGVIRMMSGGSMAHDDISANVRAALKMQFRTGPCKASGPNMRTEVTANRRYYYPDVVVSCDVADRRRDTKVVRSPRIIVEVLSPGTEPEDRGRKLRAYQDCASIMEYVLVSQYSQHVEVYRRRDDDTWPAQPVIYGPGDEVELQSIDVSIPIDEFYDGIDFSEPID
jgi:Uma2 family endonuclease